MCGICGYIGFDDEALLKRMSDALAHRGPDGDGEYIEPGVGLAHRRLAIVDLSENARQPMTNEDGSLVLVFNGEIYNHREIAAELSRKHSFRSRCDAEVVLHAYEEYGEKCVSRFNGMFAFAIWDCREKKLFAARDRFGIRPFSYAYIGGKFLFASETKALLCCPEIKREPDPEAIDEYITFRSVSGEKTMFSQVKRLLPAHTLTFSVGRISLHRYWEMPVLADDYGADYANENELAERFFELLSDSVRLRLMSDVPYGAHISGGIDSCSVASLMGEKAGKRLRSFTVGFGADIDETEDARAMAERLGAEHSSIKITGSDYKILPEIIRHLDEPVGDAITIPVYQLAKLSAEKVKVVLTGEGADEIFGAYVHQGALLKLGWLRNHWARSIMPAMVGLVPVAILDKFFEYPASLGQRGKKKLVKLIKQSGDIGQSYLNIVSLFDDDEREMLYSPGFRKNSGGNGRAAALRGAISGAGALPTLNKVIAYDIAHWLHDNILHKQDRLCMAHSIEGRYPFLDHRLVEFMARVPASLKRSERETKILLRRAMRGKLPENVLLRKKQSFYFPTEKVFGNDFAAKVRETLAPKAIRGRGYFDEGYVSKLLENINGDELVYNKQIFALLALELWHRIYIDREEINWE